ncbi:MAG: hypothetical protein A4E42_02043 [Methanoregulaceae archaeon PtaU1.Bin222]|nr:MAG: hypothetical protein A4E42_02043 [Methanoregulaceae archaeon PtaU1.Bin222]
MARTAHVLNIHRNIEDIPEPVLNFLPDTHQVGNFVGKCILVHFHLYQHVIECSFPVNDDLEVLPHFGN